MSNESTLQLQDIAKSFKTKSGSVEAVRAASLDLKPGDFTALYGPSGCGKSTLLFVAGGLLSPTRGIVRAGKLEPYELSVEERSDWRSHYVGFVFQQIHLLPYLNVLENVMATGLTTHGEHVTRHRAEQLLERFGMSSRHAHLPNALSAGEQQRVALARAAMSNPKVILADEPTGNLDTENGAIVYAFLREFCEEQNGTVLLATHDPKAREVASRVVEMRDGAMV